MLLGLAAIYAVVTWLFVFVAAARIGLIADDGASA